MRHPDEITWSSDLLADSNRRDFRINCLYWTSGTIQETIASKNTESSREIALKQHGACFMIDSAQLIIQDHAMISALFPEGKIDQDQLVSLV